MCCFGARAGLFTRLGSGSTPTKAPRSGTRVGPSAVPETGDVETSAGACAPSSAAATETIVSIERRLLMSSASLVATVFTSSRGLEPEVLESLGRGSVEGGCAAVVAAALREVALRDPRCCSVGAG